LGKVIAITFPDFFVLKLRLPERDESTKRHILINKNFNHKINLLATFWRFNFLIVDIVLENNHLDAQN